MPKPKPNAVHGFDNLPALFGGEEETTGMGYTRKDTGPVLDKIIQFIYLFQKEHEGATPSHGAISNEIGKPSVPWFITLLVDDDRLERIGKGRPFRVRILEHPKNKKAIRQLERALEAAAAIENGQHHEHSDKGIALPPSKPVELTGGAEQDPSAAAQIEPPAVAEISPPPTLASPVTTAAPAIERRGEDTVVNLGSLPPINNKMNWNEASMIVRAHGGDLELIARTYIMNTAKPGDLLEQLLERGYTVAKTHPKWSS